MLRKSKKDISFASHFSTSIFFLCARFSVHGNRKVAIGRDKRQMLSKKHIPFRLGFSICVYNRSFIRNRMNSIETTCVCSQFYSLQNQKMPICRYVFFQVFSLSRDCCVCVLTKNMLMLHAHTSRCRVFSSSSSSLIHIHALV